MKKKKYEPILFLIAVLTVFILYNFVYKHTQLYRIKNINEIYSYFCLDEGEVAKIKSSYSFGDNIYKVTEYKTSYGQKLVIVENKGVKKYVYYEVNGKNLLPQTILSDIDKQILFTIRCFDLIYEKHMKYLRGDKFAMFFSLEAEDNIFGKMRLKITVKGNGISQIKVIVRDIAATYDIKDNIQTEDEEFLMSDVTCDMLYDGKSVVFNMDVVKFDKTCMLKLKETIMNEITNVKKTYNIN